MNKIIREHYPASLLPEDLRGQFADDAEVTVTIEEELETPPSREKLLRLMREAQANAPGTTLEEAVARVRTLRDEWED
jgi:hypothetical protein